MYSKVVIVFALAAFAAANDIHEGTNNTHGLEPIFQMHCEEQWAFTRVEQQHTFSTTGPKIIAAINVFDLRDTKDGEATIVSGGVGYNNVTIILKSPAVFRGFNFFVEIYSDQKIHNGSRDYVKNPWTRRGNYVGPEPTCKPVAVNPGKPSTELPTADKASTTFATTGKPDVMLTPTTGKSDVTVGTATIPAGKPEVTGPTDVTGVPKM